MSEPTERRQFWRAHFRAGATLRTGPVVRTCRIEDISLKGALLEMPDAADIGPGQACQLLLELASGMSITMHGAIARVDARHVGLRCDSMDLDSMTHLRRLVELNAGDAGVFERDLASLLRDRPAG